MNRQQRRAMQRQKDKTVKHKNKNSPGMSIVRWVESLSKEESELCGTLIEEYTKSHMGDFGMAFMELLENFLIEKEYQEISEIMNEFIEELGVYIKKSHKIEEVGGNYYMSLNNDREKIINYYKERRAKVSHEEAMRDVYIIFNKYSKSSLKNVIKTHLKAEEIDKETNKETNKEADTEVKEVVDETNIEASKETNTKTNIETKENSCASKTCTFRKEEQCSNKYVVSGEKPCRNFNVDSLNTESKAKIFFDENKDKDRKELIKECALKFDVKETTIERYYSNYKKESEEKKKQSIINEDFEKEVQDMINSSKGEKEMSKFKILKKVVVLDLQGGYGKYHVENNKVAFMDVEYSNSTDVDSSFKIKEEELTKQLIDLRKQKEELKEVIKEYVEEV